MTRARENWSIHNKRHPAAMRAPWMAAPYPPVWPCAMRIENN